MLYKQCDPRWGNNAMGTKGNGEDSTICGEGCAMSSLSMALAGLAVPVNGGAAATPATFNSWLQANNGYTCIDGDCNNLVLDAVTRLNSTVELVGEVPKPSMASIQAGLTAGNIIYIAHVHDNGHFVLLTGFDAAQPDALSTNDPFYNSTWYPYANISDIIMYKVTSAAGSAATQRLRASTRRDNLNGATAAANRFIGHGASRASILNRADTRTDAMSAAGARDEQRLRDVAAVAVVPFMYPLYKQCDPRWGNDIINTETVCAVGCLISSTSMALAGKNLSISNSTATPGTINAWLRTHNGYDGQNDFIESSLPALNPSHISWPSDGMHTTNDVPLATIQAYLTAGRPVIAWVRNRTHFVLVIGWDASNSDTLYVNDPGFAQTTYSYSTDVVGWRLFGMKPCVQPCAA